MIGLFEPVPPPPGQLKANGTGSAPALIEGSIPLLSPLGLRSPSWLAALYSVQGLSAREISGVADATHSGVLHALDRFGIARHLNGHQRAGLLPFGLDYQDHKLVMNSAEQAAIRLMQEQRANGFSLREVAGKLNSMRVPTKQGGVWQANTVRGILARG